MEEYMDISIGHFINLIIFLMKGTSRLQGTYILEAIVVCNDSQICNRSVWALK